MIQTEYYCWLQRDASINAVSKKKSPGLLCLYITDGYHLANAKSKHQLTNVKWKNHRSTFFSRFFHRV